MTRAIAQTDMAVSLRSAYAEMEAGAQLARQLVFTPFIPDSLKRWHLDNRGQLTNELDVDGTVATVTAALLTGMELGFGAMASLRSIDVIKGTPALRAIALRALVQTRGHDLWIVEANDTRCVVRGRRGGSDIVQETTWTIDRAKQLGVYPGKEGGQWRRQPRNMLIARASAEMARWIAADSILGIPLVAEELLDQEAEDAQALRDAKAEAGALGPAPEAPKRTVRRKPAAALPAAPPAVPQQRQPVEQAHPVAAADVSDDFARPVAMVTKPQLALLNLKLREVGVTSRPDAHALVSSRVNHPIASAGELTQAEATDVIDWLSETATGMAAERERQEQDEEGEFGADDQ